MIKINNLMFKYASANNFAIDGISIEIPKGKYIAILGHNGSGKSTLSKLLVGLYRPTEGEIFLDGVKISKSTLKIIREKIGVVFQNPENQFIGACVEDDIAFGLENKKMSREEMKEKVLEYANKVNMANHLSKEPQSLSGGQKQRVAIASTLALDPEIIIFDEITSMLDPKGNREVIEIISQIKKSKKKTLISITHNMEEAIIADEIIVMSKGRVIAQGKPSEILSNDKVVKEAKIDSPFIYKVSNSLKSKGINPTHDRKELIKSICKLKQKI